MSEHLFAADFYFLPLHSHARREKGNRFAACNMSLPDLNLRRTDKPKGIRTLPQKVIAARARRHRRIRSVSVCVGEEERGGGGGGGGGDRIAVA